jgi:PQQ-like domain
MYAQPGFSGRRKTRPVPERWCFLGARLKPWAVKLPPLLIATLLALAGLGSPAAKADEADLPRVAAILQPSERFRFHAGAPLSASAGIGADGSICVGTADGYVHLLGPDGSFRWSRSVTGAITRRPVQSGELWLVATSAERIYALTAQGALYWVFRPPSPVASELAVDATGVTYFVAADHFLYGVTAHGSVSLRATFGELKAGPVAAPDGAVWAENQAGNLVRARGQDLRRLPREPTPGVDFGSLDALRDPDGHEWRVRADGVLEFIPALGSRPALVHLTSSPLLSPSWSSSAHYALICARDGLVVALVAPLAQATP